MTDPAAIPDYAAFCPRYWKECFSCPDFDRAAIRFCKRYNAAHPVVIEWPAAPERKAWWAERAKKKKR